MSRHIPSLRLAALCVGALVLVVCAVRYYDLASQPSSQKRVTDSSRAASEKLPSRTIRIGEKDVTVLIARTPEEQRQGLSGRAGLGPGEGMLFVFPKDGLYGIWMKDMLFSIDIIWLSSKGVIVSIAPNVSPDTYPQSFTPDAPARYVLELPAGFANTYRLKKGDMVQL